MSVCREFYNVDVSWDDDKGSGISYLYFLVPDFVLNREKKSFSPPSGVSLRHVRNFNHGNFFVVKREELIDLNDQSILNFMMECIEFGVDGECE